MGNFWVELGILLVLVIANGFFSGSELGVVSAKKSRLQAAAERGERGAARALKLASNAGPFLATVQIGISLIATISAVFAGENLTRHVEPWLAPLLGRYAQPVASVVVVLAVTFLTLVIGELTPKNIALRNPEGLAVRVAPFFSVLSVVARPVVWLLDTTTKGLLWLLGIRGHAAERVTEDDVRALVEQAERGGSLEHTESERIGRVLRFTDRLVRDLMTPRGDVVVLDLDAGLPQMVQTALDAGHDHFPVKNAQADVLGTLGVSDLLRALSSGQDIQGFLRPTVFVPEVAAAEDALAQMRRHRPARMAVVVDEYGDFTGLLTTTDLIAQMLGGHRADSHSDELVRREDGSYLADGSLGMHTLRETLALPELDEEEFSTLAGYVLALLGHLPLAGESAAQAGWTFEVMDMDGARIDRVLIIPPSD